MQKCIFNKTHRTAQLMQMQLPNGMQYDTVYALMQVTFDITSS